MTPCRPRPGRRTPAAPQPGWPWLNLQQAADTIGAAAVAASAVLSSPADGAWHEASRQETKGPAALIEHIRYVYGDEAPLALTVAVAVAVGEAGPAHCVWQPARRGRRARSGVGVHGRGADRGTAAAVAHRQPFPRTDVVNRFARWSQRHHRDHPG